VAGFFAGNISLGQTNYSAAGTGEATDLFLAKYASDGALLWVRGAGGGEFDEAYGVALDAAGDAYLTGYFHGAATFGATNISGLSNTNHIFVAKCDAAGNFLWIRAVAGDAEAQGSSIAVDQATNLYVAGFFAGNISLGQTNYSAAGTGEATDLFIAKYDPAGNVLWARQAGGAGADLGTGVAVDEMGHVYLTGKITGNASFGGNLVAARGADLFLAKYDPAGELLWVTHAGGNNSIFGDAGQGVALDAAGDVYVAGFISGTANFGATNVTTSGLDDLFLAKFNPSGDLIWVRQAGGANLDIAFALAIDRADHICMTGFFVDTAVFGSTNLTATSPNPDRDVFVVKHEAAHPPGLALQTTSNGLQLSWPAPAFEFVLERAAELPAPAWEAMTQSVQVIGGSRIVTVPVSGSKSFFRLKKE